MEYMGGSSNLVDTAKKRFYMVVFKNIEFCLGFIVIGTICNWKYAIGNASEKYSLKRLIFQEMHYRIASKYVFVAT